MSPAETAKTVDLDLSSMLDMEGLVRAAESEDDLACVLRCHLVLERTLHFYLDQKRVGEIKTYVKPQWQFANQLSHAVAFGLPLALAASYHQINLIRNELAHGDATALDPKQVDQLARCVNRLGEVVPTFKPVQRQYISIHKLHQGETVNFGQGGPRMDFLICAVACLQHATNWMSRNAIRRELGSDAPEWV